MVPELECSCKFNIIKWICFYAKESLSKYSYVKTYY